MKVNLTPLLNRFLFKKKEPIKDTITIVKILLYQFLKIKLQIYFNNLLSIAYCLLPIAYDL